MATVATGMPRRHLDDGVESVYAVEHGTLDGYADDGQGGVGGNDTRQGGSHSCGGDDDLDAPLAGIFGKLFYGLGRAVGRECVDFKWNVEVIEQLGGLLHNGEVGRAAHDDAYDWSHDDKWLVVSG